MAAKNPIFPFDIVLVYYSLSTIDYNVLMKSFDTTPSQIINVRTSYATDCTCL